MLIKFGVENYLSIASRQELSLVASSLKDSAAALISVPRLTVQLLPAALIYGANASGKSNVISAIRFLQICVEFSHQRGSPEGGVRRTPFLLAPDMRSLPSKFDIDFVLDNVRYLYEFAADDHAFVHEALFAFPTGKRQTWFVRDASKKNMFFGKYLRGSTKTIETLMRPNSLFLSTAAQNANEQLTPIYNYLTNLSFKLDIGDDQQAAASEFIDGKCDERIVEFLKHADTAIVSHKFDEIIQEASKPFASEFKELLVKHIPELAKLDVSFNDMRKISLGHKTQNGETVFLNLSLESRGTLRLLALLKSIFSALDKGLPLIIDELDASLHTYLAEDILSLFNSAETNKKGAQLIATTHDTNLLSAKMVRRDQIWFVEKGADGATSLYPLTDIRTRNSDNIERGYLEGRFGAVPYRGSIQSLIGSDK